MFPRRCSAARRSRRRELTSLPPGRRRPSRMSPCSGLGKQTFIVGEEPAKANAVKIAAISARHGDRESRRSIRAGKEVRRYSRRLPQYPERTSLGSPAYRKYGKMIVDQAWTPAQFAMPLGLKDVQLALRPVRTLDAGCLLQNSFKSTSKRRSPTDARSRTGRRSPASWPRTRGCDRGLDRLLVGDRGRAGGRFRGFAHHRLAPRRVVERGLDRPRPRLRRLHRAAPRRRRRRHLRDRVPAREVALGRQPVRLHPDLLAHRHSARPAAARAVWASPARSRCARR